jgi:Rrf2 family protein
MVRSGSTMQLTRAADYAVRVMIQLAALPAKERALLPALARATGAPESFLSKVLQALSRAGMINSRRGQAGGFEILDRGRQASMREVIEAIDGPIYINLCLVSGASCERKSYCPAHPFWSKAQEAMLGVLNGAIVADLAAQTSAPTSRVVTAISQLSDQRAAGKPKPASRAKSETRK